MLLPEAMGCQIKLPILKHSHSHQMELSTKIEYPSALNMENHHFFKI